MLILNVAWFLPLLSHGTSQVMDIAELTCAKATKLTRELSTSSSRRSCHGLGSCIDQSTNLSSCSFLTRCDIDGTFIPFLIPFPLFQPELPAQFMSIHPAVLAGHLSWAVDIVRPATSKPGLPTGPPTYVTECLLSQDQNRGILLHWSYAEGNDGKKAWPTVTQLGRKKWHL